MSAGGVGVEVDRQDLYRPTDTLRSRLTQLISILQPNGTGLLITVDEVHACEPTEIRELASAIQHLIREEQEIAFAAAGLAVALEGKLLRDSAITFLRRADRHTLGAVDLHDVAYAINETIRQGGRTITSDALTAAAEATAGYPFLIQLVGHTIWKHDPTSPKITLEHVRQAVPTVPRRLGALVHNPALRDISDVDRSFLLAMAQDDGPSPIRAIAQRMGVSKDYANVYRSRLRAAELIVPAGRGYIDFELPYLREYLREHAGLLAQRQITPPTED